MWLMDGFLVTFLAVEGDSVHTHMNSCVAHMWNVHGGGDQMSENS